MYSRITKGKNLLIVASSLSLHEEKFATSPEKNFSLTGKK